MTRVKRGKIALKRRRKILKYTKGFRWGRKSKERAAKEALLHAWSHAFRGRKEKKRNFRALWQVKINAALRQGHSTELSRSPQGKPLVYSRFINRLKIKNIKLDRKILADLAQNEIRTFQKLVEFAK